MSVPNADPNLNTYFHDKAGIALMRRGPDGIWRFCCWAGKSGTITAQYLEPGTYSYQLWLVRGMTQSSETVSIADSSTISIIGAKR